MTEYGVHWNFFFSLFSVSLLKYFFTSLLECRAIPSCVGGGSNRYSGRLLLLLATVAHVFHESWLVGYGGREYVFREGRGDLGIVDDNREGLLGIGGYLLLSVWAEEVLGGDLWRRSKTTPASPSSSLRCKLLSLLLLSLGGHILSANFISPPSRRLMNTSYLTWVVFCNLLVLTVLSLAYCKEEEEEEEKEEKEEEKAKKSSSRPGTTNDTAGKVASAINNNGLLVFVTANLLTGAVNLSVDTINAELFFCELLLQ